MVIKILSSSKHFAAVRYNADKVERGNGKLMVARNFGALNDLTNVRAQDYVNYFKLLSAGNKRISKPQFHAVLSAEGKSSTATELTALAERWLDKMGYGQNPYLIVFHGDTQNHHVHLVSCRVDRRGKKIASGFERVRAVAVLNALQDIDVEENCKKDVSKAMNYQFSTAAQFKLLLERKGYRIMHKEGYLELFRYGRVTGSVPLSAVEHQLRQYQRDSKRIAQLKKIFSKYLPDFSGRADQLVSRPSSASGSLYHSPFADFALRKFALELVYHHTPGKEPYGYTILDHASGNVFKGSEVMSLKEVCRLSSTKSTEGAFADLDGNRIQAVIDSDASALYFTSALEDVPATASSLVFNLQEDIDDEAILGRNRSRKGMARTNTR